MATNRLKKNSLFKAFDVWKHIENGKILRYRCFEVLPQKKFCVQSVDFYYLPIDEKQVKNLEKQFLELLLESSPNDRSKLYDSVEEAIQAHDQMFDN